MKKTLSVLRGKEHYEPIVEMNPETLAELDLKEDDVVEIKDFEGTFPLIVKPQSQYPPNSIVIAPSIMYRYGLIDGEEVEIRKIEKLDEASFIKARITGTFKSWLDHRKKLLGMPVTLDQNISLSPELNVSIIDLKPYEPNDRKAYLITPETIVKTQYMGLYNFIVVMDQSKTMLDEWRGRKKYKIARAFFKRKIQYKIRRAANLSIITLAEEPMIYINWMPLKVDLRMMFQTILERIFENITPKQEYIYPDYIELMKFLEKHLDGADPRYPPLILIISGKEYDYSEKDAALNMLERLKEKYGPYIKVVGVPIGPTYGGRFQTLRTLTENTGGTFVEARSPLELIRKSISVSSIIDLPEEVVGDWL